MFSQFFFIPELEPKRTPSAQQNDGIHTLNHGALGMLQDEIE
jgi:hypothetical protein